MAKCVCVKCGMEAFSKCPFCRSIFPTDSMPLQMYEMIFPTYLDKPEEGRPDMLGVLRMSTKVWKQLGDAPGSASRSLVDFAQIILEMKEKGLLEQFACEHEWEFKPGEVSSIGCGHKGKPLS